MSAGILLEGTFNTRDVAAGTQAGPIRLADGVLFRSASLAHLEPAGVEHLAALGVSTVLDLRSSRERDRDGTDRVPAGVEVFAPDFVPGAGPGGRANLADTQQLVAAFLRGGSDPGAAHAAMVGLYAGFATDEVSRRAVGGALRAFAAAPGAAWVHCSAGKDRTGWFVAAVQTLCGVDRDQVQAEYLRSNDAVAGLSAMIPPDVGIDPAALAPILEVHADYLQAAFDAVEENYGGLEGYLTAVGVDTPARVSIREKFGL